MLLSIDPLTSFTIRDAPDTKNCQNGFFVIGASKRIFCAASPRDKRIWLTTLRRTEGTGRAPKDDAAAGARPPPPLEEDDWLAETPRDLDVFISQRAFVQAADLADRARDSLRGSATENTRIHANDHLI